MKNNDAKKQHVEDYFRDRIREIVDEIESLNLDLGLDLDEADLREKLEPLIVSPEIDIDQLEHVHALLKCMRDRMQDWSEFRDSTDDEVDDIIKAATPDPDEEEVTA